MVIVMSESQSVVPSDAVGKVRQPEKETDIVIGQGAGADAFSRKQFGDQGPLLEPGMHEENSSIGYRRHTEGAL